MSKISKKLLNIFENYGSSATVHGISYIFKRNSRLQEKPVYILAVTGAVFFAIWSSRDIYISWKSNPVLTTIENFAYPIENIPFPSITICPQGADNNILKSVLFKQFNEYLDRKNLTLDELTIEEAQIWSARFLNETYPGAKKSPDNYVTLFRAQNLKSNIRTKANINPEDQVNDCNQTLQTRKERRKRNTQYGVCPDNTIPNGFGKCFHISENEMSYSEAVTYCEDVASDRQSSVHHFMQESDFTSLYELLDKGIVLDIQVFSLFIILLDCPKS